MRLLTQKSDTREEGEINPSEMWPNSESAPSSKQTKKPSAPPIIIVPAALTSVLTLYNVKSFLSNGEYIDTQTRRNQGEKKPKSVFVTPYSKNMQSAQSSSVQIYEVIDNAAHLRPTDWDRVVAVFALGQQWQFKKWLWDEPVTLFNNGSSFLKLCFSFLPFPTLQFLTFKTSFQCVVSTSISMTNKSLKISNTGM
jgi:parafibromin